MPTRADGSGPSPRAGGLDGAALAGRSSARCCDGGVDGGASGGADGGANGTGGAGAFPGGHGGGVDGGSEGGASGGADGVDASASARYDRGRNFRI